MTERTTQSSVLAYASPDCVRPPRPAIGLLIIAASAIGAIFGALTVIAALAVLYDAASHPSENNLWQAGAFLALALIVESF